jgi:GDP-4-dehydro-6-deoxy-D-mannose reductase
VTTGPITLVTGAAGFAGGHLLERLQGTGPLHGWALPGSRPDAGAADVAWHEVDLTSRSSVFAALRATPPDRVFHLAGAPSVETSWKNAVPHLATNALGTAHLLDAVRAHAPACRVLVVTSAQVYRPGEGPLDESTPVVPSSPYGLTKLAQDLLARDAAAQGLDIVVARPFNHIGPRQAPGFAVPSFARQIARIELGLDEPVIRVGNLDARRDFTDVRDVAEAYCRLMEHAVAGEAYNVCSGHAERIRDLLATLVSLATVPIGVEVDPARLRPSDVSSIVGANQKLRAATGWAPRLPLADTLRDTLDWWRLEAARTAERQA